MADWRALSAQLRQAHAKRHKNPAFRTEPFADAIIWATRLPLDAQLLCLGARNRREPDLWRARGYRHVVAVDLLPSWGVWPMDMHRLLFRANRFDLVYASHCFEHSSRPWLALIEAIRVVKKPGWLFAAFPVGFAPTAHDPTDFGSLKGFLTHVETVTPHTKTLWSQHRAREVAVLLEISAGPPAP